MASNALKREGRLGPLTFPALIHALRNQKTTGTLQVRDEQIVKTLYVDEGRLVFAASTDPEDRLGQLFLRRGMITLSSLKEAVRLSVQHHKRMGAVLVELKAIRPQDLVWGVSEQVKSMILSLFQWTRGDYAFREGPLPSEEMIKLKMSTPDLVLTGIRSIEAWYRIEGAVGDLDTRYTTSPQLEALAAELTLSLDEWTLLSRCEGSATLGQMCEDSALGDFEVCRLIWAFSVVGLLQGERAAAVTSSAS